MFDSAHRVGRRIVLIGGLVALLVAIVVAGTRNSPAVLGSNGVRPDAFVAVVPANRTLCQSAQAVPRSTGSLRMTIGTYGRPGPQVRVELRDPKRGLVGRGGLRAGWQEGPVSLPLDRPVARDSSARLCLTNRGTADIAVAGAPSDRTSVARIGRRIAQGRVSMLYLASRRQAYLARVAPTVDAMANAPGLWGQTAPWVVLAFAGLAISGVVRTLW